MFIQYYVYLFYDSINVSNRYVEEEKNIEKEEIIDLCLLWIDIPREQAVLTLYMYALTSSLSLFCHSVYVRPSKLINHRKSITKRYEGVSFA